MPWRCHVGIDRDRGDVTVGERHHQPRVADTSRPTRATTYDTRRAQRELADEQPVRPRRGIHLRLDAQHRAQVPAAHRRDVHLERLDQLARGRHVSGPFGPRRARRRSCAGTGQHVVGRAELLALVAGDRELGQRGEARRRVRGPGELGPLDVAERGREPQRAVAAQQRLLAARLELGDEIVGRADLVLRTRAARRRAPCRYSA